VRLIVGRQNADFLFLTSDGSPPPCRSFEHRSKCRDVRVASLSA
jgi:hypothetical protein